MIIDMLNFVLQVSFLMFGNRIDIDINDLDFWKKWVKKVDVDVEGLKYKVQYGFSFFLDLDFVIYV